MVSAKNVRREGYIFAYEVYENGVNAGFGGLDDGYFLRIEKDCPYKELVLRALIDYTVKNLNGSIYARDEWGVDLKKFGLVYQNDGVFAAEVNELCLPRCSGKC